MTKLVPKGSFSIPVAKLRRMVALSRAFQLSRNLHNETEANRFIFTEEVDATVGRPFAVVMIGENHGSQIFSGGSQNFLMAHGDVLLYLTIDTNPEFYDDMVQAEIDAANFFGQVHDDVIGLSGVDDAGGDSSHLPITGSELVRFGENPVEQHNSLGRFYFAVYRFEWSN